MEIFYNDGLTLGGNVSVAAGPIGRSFSAEVDLNLDSSIYSYSQSRGLYIGLSVQGAQVKQNRQANRQLYKESIDPEEIYVKGFIKPRIFASSTNDKRFDYKKLG